MMMSSETFAALVERANLAPSVHNTQPTRFRLEDGGRGVTVLDETARRLRVADPHGRDAAVSNGSAIEGFAIACADRGIAIDVERSEAPPYAGLQPVARIALREGEGEGAVVAPDPLAPFVDARRSYRGTFAKHAPAIDASPLADGGDVTLVRTERGIARIAALNDAGALATYRDPAYRAELVSWLRLSRRDPAYALDGLNAEAMDMTPLVAAGARAILAPRVFEVFDAIGVGRVVVAEAAAVRSAQSIALFHRPEGEDPLLTGRRFYRLWLEFERLGLRAGPMSVLADDEALRATIADEFDIPVERRLVNAFRLGVPPAKAANGSRARLARETLVV